MLLDDRQLDAAAVALQRAAELNPTSDVNQFNLAMVALLQGNPDRALQHLQACSEVYRLTGTAQAEHTRGNEQASREALNRLTATYSIGWAYQIAMVHAWRGESDQTFAWLERALIQRDAGLLAVNIDASMDSVRDDPRFAGILKRVGLPR